MTRDKLENLLERVRRGEVSPDDAVKELRDLPFSDIEYANVDHHRALRQGVPEVVLGSGKTPVQIVGIVKELAKAGSNVMVSRVSSDVAATVRAEVPALDYREAARMLVLEQAPIVSQTTGTVTIVTAGTSDLPVAEECAETLRMLGVPSERLVDVGVAGVHRLLAKRDVLVRARLLVVIAGMEGALASVVGGLVDVPVIAVPTSVGYGAAFDGLAALLGMLTSCASGITVVNIDNGFRAAFAAFRMLKASRLGE